MATTRAEFAAALSTVAGVTGYQYRPAAMRPGDAWPTLAVLERADGLAFEATWSVWVILPSDEKAASEQTDALVGPLVAALEPVAFVDRITPSLVKTSGGDLFALEITVRSE